MDLADTGDLELLRSRAVEQEVLDLLDEFLNGEESIRQCS